MNQKNYKKLIPVIVGQWRTGAYSIRDLAKKHDVSVGFIAKHTAKIEKDGLAVVNAGIQYKQGLAENDEHFVSAVNDVVNKRTEHILFFNHAAIQNVSEAMATKCENQSDYRVRAETICKGRETVLGKSPDTAVQVNTGGSLADALRKHDRLMSSELVEMINPNYK
ncbi:MAG: hypothetical protein ABIJ50_03430 [Pseudomonadota bacterium]